VVEFTIALPLMLVLFMAVSELGRAFLHYNALTRAVRDSARHVADKALLGQSGTVNIDATLNNEARNLLVYGKTGGGGQPILPGLAPGNVTVANAGNGNISVTVQYQYQPMLAPDIPALIGGGTTGGTYAMRAQVVMKAL
jgi:Flp pilus assembly protein TadG